MCNNERWFQWYPQVWHGIIPPYANDNAFTYTTTTGSSTFEHNQPYYPVVTES